MTERISDERLAALEKFYRTLFDDDEDVFSVEVVSAIRRLRVLERALGDDLTDWVRDKDITPLIDEAGSPDATWQYTLRDDVRIAERELGR